MKCPKCSKEFADGLHNCPYCGHGILQDDSEGKFNVPKFTGSYKMANPRVRNQKEAIKKINESNKVNQGGSEKPVNYRESSAPVPSSDNGLNRVAESGKNISTTTATATNVSVSGGTSDNVATARKKPLTREDLEAMQRNLAARSQNQAQSGPQPENHSENENESYSEHNNNEDMEELQNDVSADDVTQEVAEEPADTEDSKESKKRKLFGGKKQKKEKKERKKKENGNQQQSDMVTYEEDSEPRYDVNLDGYYDDLIPELAHQINKIPQENIIKVVFIVIFVVIMCFIILYTS